MADPLAITWPHRARRITPLMPRSSPAAKVRCLLEITLRSPGDDSQSLRIALERGISLSRPLLAYPDESLVLSGDSIRFLELMDAGFLPSPYIDVTRRFFLSIFFPLSRSGLIRTRGGARRDCRKKGSLYAWVELLPGNRQTDTPRVHNGTFLAFL